jgi:hypothetical protein
VLPVEVVERLRLFAVETRRHRRTDVYRRRLTGTARRHICRPCDAATSRRMVTAQGGTHRRRRRLRAREPAARKPGARSRRRPSVREAAPLVRPAPLRSMRRELPAGDLGEEDRRGGLSILLLQLPEVLPFRKGSLPRLPDRDRATRCRGDGPCRRRSRCAR